MVLSSVQEYRTGAPLVDAIRRTWHLPTARGARHAPTRSSYDFWARLQQWGTPVTDALVVSTTVVVLAPMSEVPLRRVLAVAVCVGLLGVLCIALLRGYDLARAGFTGCGYAPILKAAWLCATIVLVAAHFESSAAGPGTVLEPIGVASVALMCSRFVQRLVMGRLRRRGRGQRATLLVGNVHQVQRLSEEFRTRVSHGLDVVGACLPAHVDAPITTTVLGDVDQAAEVVIENQVRVVVVSASCMPAAQLRRFCWRLAARDVELLIAPDVGDVDVARMRLCAVPGTPMVALRLRPSLRQRIAKAALDRALGSLLLLAALPVLGVSGLLIRLGSSGPILYRQTRLGKDGREFTMFKLRTMVADAEVRRSDLLVHSDGNNVMFKMRADPRVTPVGRFLRRFSVDELPQLWNVVRGDMSLVGPRPPLADEVAQYGPDARQRLRVRPGLTGLWQVSGRADLDWDQTIRLDLDYVDNWSMRMDLQILARTFGAVFGGRGAY